MYVFRKMSKPRNIEHTYFNKVFCSMFVALFMLLFILVFFLQLFPQFFLALVLIDYAVRWSGLECIRCCLVECSISVLT